jgi:hypothetical protein
MLRRSMSTYMTVPCPFPPLFLESGASHLADLLPSDGWTYLVLTVSHYACLFIVNLIAAVPIMLNRNSN